MKLTKFSKAVSEKLDNSKLYNIEEAFNMLMNFKREAFTESVDVAFNLGLDPRHADENIRFSYAASEENIKKAIKKIKHALKKLK